MIGKNEKRVMAVWKFVLLFIVVVMLLSQPSAFAECAWVLWEEQESTSSKHRGIEKEIKLHKAYKNKEECDAARYALWRYWVDQWTTIRSEDKFLKEIKKADGEYFQLRFEMADGGTTYSSSEYKCLPDSIDPTRK